MRPTNVLPYSEVVSEIENKCKASLKHLIEKHYNQMPSYKKRILSKGYKITTYVLMVTILIGIIMFLIRFFEIKKINNMVKKEIGNEKIYSTALEGTDISMVTGSGKIPDETHYLLRVRNVPSDAKIVKSFDGLKGISLKNTDMISNAVKFRWIRYYGRSIQVRYYTQAMLVIGCDEMTKFEFNLKRESFASKLSRREKKKLESREFEKQFNIKNNDELKLRQSFTPMVQENYVKYNNEDKLRRLKIIKSGNLLYVVWGTRDDYLTVKGSKLKDGSMNDIVDMLWANVKKDLSEFYTASAYGISLPFYKPKQTTHQGNLESTKTHDRLKKGFTATVIANRFKELKKESS